MDDQIVSKPKKKLSKVEKTIRISSKGRMIRTPANLLTTSSDEAPICRKPASIAAVKAQLARLQDVWKVVEAKKANKKNTSSENNEIKRKKAATNCNFQGKDTEPHSPRTASDSSKTPGNYNVSNLEQSTNNQSLPSIMVMGGLENSANNVSNLNNNVLAKTNSSIGKKCEEFISKNSSANRDDSSDSDETFHTHENILDTPRADFFEPIQKSLETIKTQNETILEQNKKIIETMEKLEIQLNQRNLEPVELSNTLYNPLEGYPMSTVEEFNELNLTENKERRRKLHSNLVQIGGSKLRDFLSCAVRRTMTDELVCRYTWNKQAGTEGFGDTRVANVFFKAAEKCWQFVGPRDVTEFNNEITEVFRATKQTHRNSLRKKNLVEPSTSADEEDLRKQIDELHKLINNNDMEVEEADDEMYSDDSL